MKKKYQDETIFVIVVLVFIVITILIFSATKIKYDHYKVIIGSMYNEDMLKLIVNDDELALLNKSKYLYLKDHKQKYEPISVTRNVLKKDKHNYHEIIIKTKLPKRIKTSDYVNISFFVKKENVYELLKKIWKEKR
ncbi:MAG: hypothetical protein IJH13_00440 [Bacilli bacterium]|nr:hypothetical protein [Bacilli bacterium]